MEIRKKLKKIGLVTALGVAVITGAAAYKNVVGYESAKEWFDNSDNCSLAKNVLGDIERSKEDRGLMPHLFNGNYGGKLAIKGYLKSHCKK